MRLLFSFYYLVNFLKVWLSLFLSLCPHTHSTHPLVTVSLPGDIFLSPPPTELYQSSSSPAAAAAAAAAAAVLFTRSALRRRQVTHQSLITFHTDLTKSKNCSVCSLSTAWWKNRSFRYWRLQFWISHVRVFFFFFFTIFVYISSDFHD